MAEYRKIGEITNNSINNKRKLNFAISGDDYKYLREEAFRNDTSIAEIIRVITREHIDLIKEEYGELPNNED